MIKKILEKIFGCFHDWEVIEIGPYAWTKNFERVTKTDYNCISKHRYYFGVKKVCLKCFKCVDEISMLKEIYEQQKQNMVTQEKEKAKRQKLANDLWQIKNGGCGW